MNSTPPPIDAIAMALVAWKATGAAIGSVLSLVYIRPNSIKDAISRAVISAASGFMFGFVLHEYLGWADTAEKWIAASAAVAFVSWVAIGMIYRIIGSINSFPKKP